MNDDELVEEIVEAVGSGAARSRSEIAATLGFSGGRASRLIGLAVRSKRLRAVGRDRFQSPVYEVVSTPSAVIHEVAGLAGACA
jgi:hypothetical protein